MNINFVIKAMCWAISVIIVLVALIAGLWFHPIITIITVIAGWILIMRYLDPPDKWN